MKYEYSFRTAESGDGGKRLVIDMDEKYSALADFLTGDFFAFTDFFAEAVDGVLSGNEKKTEVGGNASVLSIKKRKTTISNDYLNYGKGASCKIPTTDLRELMRISLQEKRRFETAAPTLYEQAHYHRILLCIGMDDGFDAWVDTLLERGDDLAGRLSELAFCRGDLNDIISLINKSCPVSATNAKTVLAMLRAFWLRKYRENNMSRCELAEKMYACYTIFRESEYDFPDSGYGMSLLIDYCILLEDGIISNKAYDQALVRYLETREKPDFWK